MRAGRGFWEGGRVPCPAIAQRKLRQPYLHTTLRTTGEACSQETSPLSPNSPRKESGSSVPGRWQAWDPGNHLRQRPTTGSVAETGCFLPPLCIQGAEAIKTQSSQPHSRSQRVWAGQGAGQRTHLQDGRQCQLGEGDAMGLAVQILEGEVVQLLHQPILRSNGGRAQAPPHRVDASALCRQEEVRTHSFAQDHGAGAHGCLLLTLGADKSLCINSSGQQAPPASMVTQDADLCPLTSCSGPTLEASLTR